MGKITALKRPGRQETTMQVSRVIAIHPVIKGIQILIVGLKMKM